MGVPYSIGSYNWPGLAKVVEESGELGQVLGKLIMIGGDLTHWDGDLTSRLEEELGDLLAALEFFIEVNSYNTQISSYLVYTRKHEKLALFHKWHKEGNNDAN